MRGVERTSATTMRRSVAAAGLTLSLLAVPAGAAIAAPSPSPSSSILYRLSLPAPKRAASASARPSGLSLPIGSTTLSVPLPLNIGGLLQLGSASASTTPRNRPSTSRGRSSALNRPPATLPSATTPSGPQPGGGGVGAQPAGQPSPGASASSRHSSAAAKDTPGTGSLVLTQRLLGNATETLLAALLAGTALAVIAFARLGGIRRRGPRTRQH